jgi:nicotinamide mononucleotide adenylyltransferase
MSTATSAREPLVAVCGKFQPLHNEHLQYILGAFEVGDHVIIGITNPDPGMTRPEIADPVRSLPESNQFTYYERYAMVRNSLFDNFVDPTRFDIVPFPINLPEMWPHYIPSRAVFLITLYKDDEWLEVRRKKLEDAGLSVRILWSKTAKGITGSEVRALIKNNQEWEHLVPPGAARVIREVVTERGLRP